MRPNSHRHTAKIAAIASGLALTACGSSSSTSTSASSGYSQAVKFSGCMRAHGVPNFPDPTTSGSGIQLRVGPSSGVDPRSPAFRSAQQACAKLLPGGGPPTQLSARDRQAALTFARCMRAHGEPDFPDPTRNIPSTPSPGTRTTVIALAHIGAFVLGQGIDPQSPAFRRAAAACGLKPPGGAPPK